MAFGRLTSPRHCLAGEEPRCCSPLRGRSPQPACGSETDSCAGVSPSFRARHGSPGPGAYSPKLVGHSPAYSIGRGFSRDQLWCSQSVDGSDSTADADSPVAVRGRPRPPPLLISATHPWRRSSPSCTSSSLSVRSVSPRSRNSGGDSAKSRLQWPMSRVDALWPATPAPSYGPGPGAHTPQSKDAPRSADFGCGPGHADPVPRELQMNPGPGDYEAALPASRHVPTSVAFGGGHVGPQTNTVPGPGAYNVAGKRSAVRSVVSGFCSGPSRFEVGNSELVAAQGVPRADSPGPAAYNVRDKCADGHSWRRSSGVSFKHGRGHLEWAAPRNPGPGAYEVTWGFRRSLHKPDFTNSQ